MASVFAASADRAHVGHRYSPSARAGRAGPFRCEHTYVMSPGHGYAEFKRALERGNLWVAEAAARDLPQVSLEDALRLVHLYAEKRSPKFERAAMRWLERYLLERRPTFANFAKVVRSLERCALDD